jgi:hypothetical protein
LIHISLLLVSLLKENATPTGRRKPSAVVFVPVTFLTRKGQHGALRPSKMGRHRDEAEASEVFGLPTVAW